MQSANVEGLWFVTRGCQKYELCTGIISSQIKFESGYNWKLAKFNFRIINGTEIYITNLNKQNCEKLKV